MLSRGFVWLPKKPVIQPFNKPNQIYNATKTDTWSSLLRPDSSLFLASFLPGADETKGDKSFMIQILWGSGNAEEAWMAFTFVPETKVQNNDWQFLLSILQIVGAPPNSRAHLTRALRFDSMSRKRRCQALGAVELVWLIPRFP